MKYFYVEVDTNDADYVGNVVKVSDKTFKKFLFGGNFLQNCFQRSWLYSKVFGHLYPFTEIFINVFVHYQRSNLFVSTKLDENKGVSYHKQQCLIHYANAVRNEIYMT